MKKIKVSMSLIISIILIAIVFFTSIYTLTNSQYVVSDNTIKIIIIALLVFTIIGIILMIVINNKKQIKPENALLCILTTFSIFIFITIPIGRGHDETMHWYKSFEISQGQLMTPISEKTRTAITTLPDGVQKIAVEREKAVFKYIDNIPLLSEKLNFDKSIITGNQNSAAYCFVQYIPEVLGIMIGQIFTQTPILIAYFARLVNMLVCIAIMYFAVKLIPFGKNILLLLSIIPIAIEGFATISPDGLTIAICALFISYTLYLAFDKNKMVRNKRSNYSYYNWCYCIFV